MHRFTINVPLPDDFSHYLPRIAARRRSGMHQPSSDVIGVVLSLSGGSVYVTLRPGDGKSQYEVALPEGQGHKESEVRSLLGHIFSFDIDLRRFYEHVEANEPELAHIIPRFAGARMLRESDVFSATVSSIISQQLNTGFAAELRRRLWQLCGEEIIVGNATLWADPAPESLADLEVTQLQEMQFSRQKAEYLIGFAREVCSGRLDLNRLADLDDESAINRLSEIRGIGRWTAECALIFGLGRDDLLPAKDIGLMRSASRIWQQSERVSETELRERSQGWTPWRSWYSYYLWLADSEYGRRPGI